MLDTMIDGKESIVAGTVTGVPFENDIGSFNEIQVVSVADEYQRNPSLLNGMLVYDDDIVKGVIHGSFMRRADLGIPGNPVFWREPIRLICVMNY